MIKMCMLNHVGITYIQDRGALYNGTNCSLYKQFFSNYLMLGNSAIIYFQFNINLRNAEKKHLITMWFKGQDM